MFPALEPISITFDLSGLLGVNVSNASGMAYQITATGEGRHQLTTIPWIPQDCGDVWNTQQTQLRELFGTTTAYAIRGDQLLLTGADLSIHFEIDNSPLPVKAYSVCTEIADQEPNSMVTMYAETFGLTYEEAERRLELQAEMSLLEGKVIEGEPTYAGLWMEHAPEFGLVVAFASPDGEDLIQKYLEGIAWADLVHVKQMPYTIDELLAISEQVRLAAYKTGIPFASGTNIKLAKTTFYTAYPEELQRQLEADPSIQPYLDEIEYIYEAAPAVPADLQNSSHAAPEVGVVVDEMMKVVDVDPGNAADKAGVQKGDILIAIEDIPFATEKAKAEELIWGSADEAVYEEYAKTGEWKGKILRLRVERNGENMDLEIMPFPPIWDPQAPPTPGYPPLDYL